MDKNMLFVIMKIWRHFRKESHCSCYFSMLYFICENTRDMEQPNLLPLNELAEENLNEKDDV